MFKMKISLLMVVLLGTVCFLGACDAGQTDEANKLVDAGNALVNKNNETNKKVSALLGELLGEGSSKVEDSEKHKTDNKAKFDELISLCGQLEKDGNEAASKFEQASKLKVDEKFKEYLTVGVQEFRKRAELDKARGDFVKAYVAEKDEEKMNSLISEFNKKSEALAKEADELSQKADKISKDNPNVIKK